jgi:hypothetical protein
MATEVDDFSFRHIKSVIFAGVSAGQYLQGVMPCLKRGVDRLITFDRADASAVDTDLKSTAAELNAGALPS